MNSLLKFSEVLQNIKDCIIIADAAGKITHVNQSLIDLLGYDRVGLIGRNIGDVFADDEFVRKTFVKIRHNLENDKSIDTILITGKGSDVPVSVIGSPLDDSSCVVLIVSPKVDNTAVCRKDAEGSPSFDSGYSFPANGTAFRDLVEKSLVGIFVVRDGKFIYVNPKMAEIFDYDSNIMAEIVTVLDIVTEADRKMFSENLSKLACEDGKSLQFTFSGQQKGGNIIDVEAYVACMNFNGGKAVIGSLHEITERMLMEEAMRHQAYHDPLTSLPNRILFNVRLAAAIKKAQMNRTKIAVLFLDLDRFKIINDTRGHNTGDMVLQSIAGLLRGCLRESDTVARMGGDEYTIMLSQVNQDEDAILVAQKILAAVNQKWMLDGHRISLTTSIGISIYPDDGWDAETLIRKADTAMYHVKGLGGNAIRLYDPSLDACGVELRQLENDLRTALENGELNIHYQPQVDLASWIVTGVEALIRWNHPERGLLYPKQFMPLAEKAGLIVPIGEWVLRMACIEVKRWQNKGFGPLQLSVNVSAVQLLQHDFAEMVDKVLRKTMFSPKLLNLEIAEGVALQNLDAILPNLMKLTNMGVQFVIDDFGMGYSSLNFLKRLPVQSVKIDKGLMKEFAGGAADASIITALIALAKSLNLETSAEGVETQAQVSFLRKSCCDKMQGFLFSHPLPPSEMEKLLK
ncbi:MAG TPA: EAL domain-containing protein [Dissulfurispiraceae bacterium]|nr:EAL domain-containing protein [Dissulfurispiraceae bacterium]